MKVKGFSIVIIALLLCLVFCFVGCNNTIQDEPTSGQYNEDISNGVNSVCTSVKNVTGLTGASAIYVSLSGSSSTTDSSLSSNDYPTDFSLKARINISEENQKDDKLSVLAFTVSKQTSSGAKRSILEIYYKEGVLYVSYPPLFTRSAIKNFNLAKVATVLYNSKQNETGKLYEISNLIPSFLIDIFNNLTVNESEGQTDYSFSINYNAVYEALDNVLSNASIGFDVDELLSIFSLNSKSFEELAKGEGSLVVNTITKRAEQHFQSATYTHKSGTVERVVNINDFILTAYDESMDLTAYPVVLAENLSSYTHYDFANVKLYGDMILKLSSTSALPSSLLGLNATLDLSMTEYPCLFELTTNNSENGFEGLIRLYNIGKDKKEISIYINNDSVYLDLSNVIGKEGTNNGYISLTKENAKKILSSLGIVVEKNELSAIEIAGGIGHLLSMLDKTENCTDIKVDSEVLPLLLKSVGYNPIIDWNKLNIVLNTESSSFKGISVDLSTAGIAVNISALEPSIGSENIVDKPQWLEKCLSFDEISTITPVIEGDISTNLGASNNALVEALIYSVSGKEVSLEGNSIKSFKASFNCSYSGALSNLRIDFIDSDQRNVCSLYYYNNLDEAKYLYVIQTVNGIDHVEKLELLTSSRYGELAHFIHGNYPVEDSPANIGITNNSQEVSFKFNQEGLNELIKKLSSIFPDLLIKSVPQELGLSALSVTVGNPEIKGIFGNGKHIDLSITSFTIGYDSLAVKTTDVKPTTANVSIYDDNNLPEKLEVTVGTDKGDKRLTVLAEDFGGWLCDNPPRIGDGEVEVSCYVKVFGQKVFTTITVDCSNATDIRVVENAGYSDYVSNNIFTFDRYQTEVDPFDVINNRFNKVYVMANITSIKPVIWYYGNGATKQRLSEECYKNNNNISYLITPAIVDFFGFEQLFTSKQFEIKLSGDSVTAIEGADDFYTISAFNDEDPFNQSTYNNRISRTDGDRRIYLLTGRDENVGKISFDRLNWNINSIKNSTILKGDGKKYSNDELKTALKEELYKLSGKYTLSASISDCLGTVTELEATITVEPRIIQSVSLNDLTYGSTFIKRTDEGDHLGLIVFDPMQISRLDSSVSIAKSLSVTFKDQEHAGEIIPTVKWEISALDLPLSSASTINGTLSAVIGDETSGYQRFTFDYIVRNYKLTELALGAVADGSFTPLKSEGNLVIDGEYKTDFSFVLENQDPYSYHYPDAIRLTFEDFRYEYNGIDNIILADSIVKNVSWNFENWVESSLWQNSEKVYSDSISIANLKIDLSISFMERKVSEWKFADVNGIAINDYQKTPVASANRKDDGINSYVADDKGDYVFKNGLFIPYNEEEHRDNQRYKQSGSANKYDVFYAKPNSNEVERIILDPNAVNYLDQSCYPSKALVKFEGDSEFTLVDIFWDLAPLENSTDVQKNGYYGKLTVRLAYSQIMDHVDLWIASSNPSNYYANPYFEDYTNENNKLDQRFNKDKSNNSIELSLISVNMVNGKNTLQINDLFSDSGIHSAICGCNEKDCKGRIYLYYDNDTMQSGMFPVSEWIGLEQIKGIFNNALAKGTAIENISGAVTIQAKVGDLLLNVPVQINSSVLLDLKLSGIPHVNNSTYASQSGSAYTVDNKLFFDVDPYLTSATDQSFYPTVVGFTYKGQEVNAKIDSWDCSVFNGVKLYNGASGTVYACFDTPMGTRISIPVTVNVKRRIIESVSINDSTIKRIDIDCYSSSPFGENTALENGRVMAYKSVSVKFVDDDHLYPLIMKYDVTDLSVSFRGGLVANNVTVYIGNDAGGYQAISGYSIYASQKILLKAYSEAVEAVKNMKLEDGSDATLESKLKGEEKDANKNILNGIIYSHNGFVPSFTDFGIKEGDSEYVKLLKNKAWEALIIGSNTIKFDVGYTAMGEGNTAVYKFEQITASEYVANQNGLSYRWTRGDDGIVELELFNIIPGLDGMLGDAQVINSGNKNYVLLTDDMFKYNRPSAKEYSPYYTVKDYIDFLQMRPNDLSDKLFSLDDINISVLDRNNNELTLDSVLTVGSYRTKVSVTTEKFNGSILVDFEISQKIVSQVVVRLGENTINRDNISLNAGTGLNIRATASYQIGEENINVEVLVQFYDDGGSLLLPDQTGFYPFSEIPGEYTIKFFAVDKNYKLNRDDIALTINEVR